ncbi:preprotein translocase subunit SecY [Candidatus Woesearchaeota archaeon]|nr:preprotein translocase subunit SecY [Candidatus Woesearchaeota archaeon]
MAYKDLLRFLPEVKSPTQKHVSFKQKLIWTGLVLLIFFILGAIPLFGLDAAPLRNFQFLSVVLGASFGSIISLGIGPIVTASIVLQLLAGSGLIGIDTSTAEGKALFQGTQKILTYFFILLEGIIYVKLGGLQPIAGYSGAVILQLFIGGVIIVFLDDLLNKWGFGSGVSLFIAAGVSQQIFIQALSPLHPIEATGTAVVVNQEAYAGAIPKLLQALSSGQATAAGLELSMLVATLLIFAVVVFAQAMKVEIPLSFGRIRGHGVRWPLNFVYTNVLPVILVSALVANLQLFSSIGGGTSWFSANVIPFLTNTNLLQHIIQRNVTGLLVVQSITYMLFFVGASVLFSWFWMQTSGLDPRSQAKQMMSSGLQIPGFRKDQRVLERLLKKYIYPLTIMGGIFIGFLASIADMTGAFGSGTGLLLTVMIIYKLYEDIAKQHMEDMNPMLRKMMGK